MLIYVHETIAGRWDNAIYRGFEPVRQRVIMIIEKKDSLALSVDSQVLRETHVFSRHTILVHHKDDLTAEACLIQRLSDPKWWHEKTQISGCEFTITNDTGFEKSFSQEHIMLISGVLS
ncbi:MAG TPA: hypothetical protein PK765_03945 [bacterium]|nr:hypothetical protein [bacterium]